MQFENLNIIQTNDSKQWYMTVDQVALGYGVSDVTIRRHLQEHADEIREGVERGVSILNTLGGPQSKTILYREGVIKLGFFVRSQQAKNFRQWATNLISNHMDKNNITMEMLFDQIQDVKNICNGFRDEIDELRATLNLFMNENDVNEIKLLIKRVKATKGIDGRAVVGHVRKTLNVGSIYGTPDVAKVKNVLKNLLGEGLSLL